MLADKTQDDYREDMLLRRGVERSFEIIGEAIRRLVALDPEVASEIGDTSQMIAFRNILIHGYDLIRDEEVWNVAKSNLPKLLETVSQLLSS